MGKKYVSSIERDNIIYIIKDAELHEICTALQLQISTIPKFNIEVVETLPDNNISTTTIYLVPNNDNDGNMYDEYIFTNNEWELIGTQTMDLSGYATEAYVDEKIGDIETALDNIIAIQEELIGGAEI